MKKSFGLILILLLIIMALGGYIVYDKLLSNNNETYDDTINYNELAKIGKADYNLVHVSSSNEHSLNIASNGKVFVDFDSYISNVNNTKDAIIFSGPGTEVAYILTNSGDVYKYDFNDNFKATKLDEYSNIKKMINYKTRKGNAGGCDYIILIDNKGNYQELDSFCV